MKDDVEYRLGLQDKFSGNINKADKSLSGFTGSVAGAVKAIAALEAVRIGYSIGKELVQLGAKAESTQIAFATMLNSENAGDKLIKQLNELAVVTPFTSSSIKDSAKQLLAYGFSSQEVIPTIKNLGDIASGVGMDKLPNLTLALGQVRAASRLTGMELRQFTEAGVPMLEYLSQVTGKSVKEVQKNISAGKISYQMVLQALNLATSEGGKFFNMMEKQSKTVEGLWSTFEDKVELTATALGKRLNPSSKAVTKSLIGMADAVMGYVKIGAAEEIENERTKVNQLAFQLANTNIPLSERNKIYEYLKKEHPEIVKGISMENIEMDKLNANVAKYNDLSVKRIMLANLTEQEAKSAGKAASAMEDLVETEAKMGAILIEQGGQFRDIAFSQDTFAEKANKAISLLKAQVKLGTNAVRYHEIISDPSALEIVALNLNKQEMALVSLLNLSKDYNENLKENNENMADVNALRKRNAMLRKMFGIADEQAATIDAKVKPDKNLSDVAATLKSASPKTFNINIQNLIDTFNVSTTTLKEGTNDIKSHIINTLAEALADIKAQTNA